MYQYSFAGNPNWSKFYAGGAEIQQYLKDVAWRYDVEKYVRLDHLFERAGWDETAQKWTVSVKDLKSNKVRRCCESDGEFQSLADRLRS